MAKYHGSPIAIVRVHADGGVAMNDVAVALIFGSTPGQIAARKLYSGGSPVENATKAMRQRAIKRRKIFTKATGEPPTELGMVKYWAQREGVGVMYRVDGEETVMIDAEGTTIDRFGELETAHG
ncbi:MULTISPECIES: hypothetical protein [Gordonia]|uniref:Uncharacterized protein n=1 Tax=Gordonia sputi NBRC 100414 TaxID=1089453 RepID=H5TYE3_9ACTN|nr:MULTISPECIES: hypothetical protein [Gordonia]NKY92741.1 hypothetical protein [Gordonia sputi]OBA38486.1 hypothetical protein A5766_04715 [Gordonia sp. 852002-51296_SCH5728562-b]GAB38501.1 hypothetical protein GOSPT_045_01390 [Gordonia sputi NBRC 100414]